MRERPSFQPDDRLDLRDPPPEGSGRTAAAGLLLIPAVVCLGYGGMLMVAASLGSALGGSPSSGTGMLVATSAAVALAAAAIGCGASGAGLGRRLGALWAVLGFLLLCVGLVLLFGVLTARQVQWP